VLELLNQYALPSNRYFESINEAKFQTKILIESIDLNVIRSLVL